MFPFFFVRGAPVDLSPVGGVGGTGVCFDTNDETESRTSPTEEFCVCGDDLGKTIWSTECILVAE